MRAHRVFEKGRRERERVRHWFEKRPLRVVSKLNVGVGEMGPGLI